MRRLVTLALERDGRPVRGADVRVSFAMLDMEMGEQTYRLTETRPGVYARAAPALVMVGHWGLEFDVALRGGDPFYRVHRRPGRRMTWARFTAALAAAAAGATAFVVAILLLRDALA